MLNIFVIYVFFIKKNVVYVLNNCYLVDCVYVWMEEDFVFKLVFWVYFRMIFI